MQASTTPSSAPVIRPMEPGEDAFVFVRWIWSMLGPAADLHEMARRRYHEREQLLRRLGTTQRMLVADDLEQPEGKSLVGFCCYTPLGRTAVVHYLYVCRSHRRRGIGRSLLEAAGVNLRAPVPYTMLGPMVHVASAAGLTLHSVEPKDIP